MHKSLASILGLALGSAVAYSPLPATAQTPWELELYERHTSLLYKEESLRIDDDYCAEIARLVKKDPLSRKICLEEFLRSCKEKVVVLPQTCQNITETKENPKYTPSYDWIPFLKECARHQKILVIFPSAFPHEIEGRRFDRWREDVEVKNLLEGIVGREGLMAKGVYAESIEGSSYLSDLEEAKRVKAIQTQHPDRIIFIAGEFLSRFLPARDLWIGKDERSNEFAHDVIVGAPLTYPKAGLKLMMVYPVDHTIDHLINLKERASDREERLRRPLHDGIGWGAKAEVQHLKVVRGYVGAIIEDRHWDPNVAGKRFSVYIPYFGRTK